MNNDLFKTMLRQATAVMENAYVPYSHFKVGACLLAENNQLYSGCNVENASYSLVLCAESCALASLISDGNQHIKEALIVSESEQLCSPCGACRQRLYEFANKETLIHLCNIHGKCHSVSIADLLPYPFDATYLETT